MLSERISTWRPIRSGRKNWQARQTASISKQLMWKPLSVSDQWPKVGLPSHSAPQPVLEASVVTTFLVWTNPIAMPFSIHRGFFQGVRAVTQAWFTLISKRPWRHALCATRGFNQRWRGRMRSRPSCNGEIGVWRNWPWAPGALSGWGWGFCVKVVPLLTGPEWASRRGSWECGFPSVSEGKEPRPCTS